MYIPMEEEVRLYLIIGFSIVMTISFIYVIRLWVVYKRREYIWFILHFLSLGFGMITFIHLIIGPNFSHVHMTSENNSIQLAQAGLLWVLSVFFLLKGISELSKYKSSD